MRFCLPAWRLPGETRCIGIDVEPELKAGSPPRPASAERQNAIRQVPGDRPMLKPLPKTSALTGFCGLFDRGCVPPCMARPNLFAGD